ncbi:hypothetical protein BC938DRAFT_477619, partial [Jimgerdemannia flammicorona]
MPGSFIDTQPAKDLFEEIFQTLDPAQIIQQLNLQRPHADLNWFGEITRIERDKPMVEVGFINGERVQVPVGKIMVVDMEDEEGADFDYEDEEDEWATDEEDEDAGSWETLSDAEGKEDKEGEGEDEDVEMENSTADNARDRRRKKDRTRRKEQVKATGEDELNNNDVDVQEQDKAAGVEQADVATPQHLAKADDERWTRFAILEDAPADHHFIGSPVIVSTILDVINCLVSRRYLIRSGQIIKLIGAYWYLLQSASAGYYKRISREYKILEASLPDNILVRGFEDRMDLFRVLIVGPSGTPYEDTLFLFDFQFPSAFPQEPPSAYFHSWTNGIGRVW